MLRELAVVATALTLANAQGTFYLLYPNAIMRQNLRLVFEGAGLGCSFNNSLRYARVEVYQNNRWNAMADCSSSGIAFITSDQRAVCYGINLENLSTFSLSGRWAFEIANTSSALTSSAPASNSPNRLFFSSSFCSVESFCDCSVNDGTNAASICSSTIYNLGGSTGMGSGTTNQNRDRYVRCEFANPSTAGQCFGPVTATQLYSSTNATLTGVSCFPASGNLAAAIAALAGALIAVIVIASICGLCCLIGCIVMICGGGVLCGVALCGKSQG